jgi:SPP1 gp7 family putative phage head morphogenesis protein
VKFERKKIRLRLDTSELVDRLTEVMVAADILGRVRVLMETARKGAQVNPMGRLAAAVFAEKEKSKIKNQKSRPSGFRSAGFSETLGYESVTPEEATDFIKSLTSFTKAAAKRLAPQYRQAAFTVAHVEEIALLDRTKELLGQALEEGWTQQEFIDRLNESFDSAGVTRLNPYHAELVFQQNMTTAYSNGRYQQMHDSEVLRALPFWRYRTMEDERVRRNHRVLDGFVARADDAVWSYIYPPNGFSCRCMVEPLLRSEGEAALGTNLNMPGSKRLPAGGGPDEGFESKPGVSLRQLASGEPL